MKREYQLIYRQKVGGELSPLMTVNVVAESPDKAAQVLARQEDLVLIAAQEGLAIVDWSKPVFDLQEAAAALSRSDDFITIQQAKGRLPKSKSGMQFFCPRVLTEFVEEGKAA